MENYLLIYLTDRTAEYAHWAWVNETGVTMSQNPCLLSDCPKPEHKTETIVLFPSEEIFLTTTALPPTKRSQQATAALYALEEKLSEDVLDLHAVVLSQPTPNIFSIGIMRRDLLENWLEKFKAANIQPQCLLPDIFAIPYQENHWTVLFFHHRLLVRTGLSQGFATQEIHYDLLVNKQAHPDIIDFKEKNLELFLKTSQENKKLLSSFNLLQGKYKQKKHWLEVRKVWQLPVILSIIWLALWSSFIIIQYIIVNTQSAKLDKQISALYYQVYPEASSLISPQERLDQEITKLKNNQSNQQSLFLIATTGNILKNIPQTILENLNFRDNSLRINIQTKDFQSLEKIVTILEKAHLDVKQSDAARAGENVTATLAINTSGDSHDKNR